MGQCNDLQRRPPAKAPPFGRGFGTWCALGQIRLSFVLIVVPGFVLELTNHAFKWINVISDAEAGGLEKAPSLVGVEVTNFQDLPNFWNRLVGRYGDIPGGNRK